VNKATTKTKKPAKKIKATGKLALKSATSPNATPKKAVRKKVANFAGVNSAIFLPRDEYKRHIDGLMAQGLDREDAIHTLKVGIREANGRTVPANLSPTDAANSAAALLAA
jgi:hypothetical protein